MEPDPTPMPLLIERPAEGLQEPLQPLLRRRLRRAVLDHVEGERRRTHPAVLHAGEPGGRSAAFDLDLHERTDPGLRVDVVAALLRRAADADADGEAPAPLLWLTRTGELDELQDVDAQWLAAAMAACREAELPLVFVVVGRHGWHDPRSGLAHTWLRARDRSASARSGWSGSAN